MPRIYIEQSMCPHGCSSWLLSLLFHSCSIFKKACRANGITKWPSKLERLANIQERERAETREREQAETRERALNQANEAEKLVIAAMFTATPQPPTPVQSREHLSPLQIEVEMSVAWAAGELTHEPVIEMLSMDDLLYR